MATLLRRQGISAETLPTRKTTVVTPADFGIGGLIGKAERSYKKAFQVRNMTEYQDIFGVAQAANYLPDAVLGFFASSSGVPSQLYIKAHVGTPDGTTYDAVTAFSNIVDQSAANTIKVEDAYQTELAFGVSGNRTARKLTRTPRFSTTLAATVASGATSATLVSVIGVIVGDLVKFIATGAPGATIYKKITAVDQSARTVTWVGAFHGSASGVIGDATTVEGFTVQTYRKTELGQETEVETELGKIVCTLEPEVTQFYLSNIHAANRFIKLTDLASASTPTENTWPSSDANPVYMTSGSDGTSPTTAVMWKINLAFFNALPVRFLANADTTVDGANTDGEAYCVARQDKPKWGFNAPSNKTKAQLITYGQSFQRANETAGFIAAQWLYVDDPFASAPNAPFRAIPNVGDVMGAWVFSIATNGVHFVPAVTNVLLPRVRAIVGDQIIDDNDRTDVANAGVNVIHQRAGIGVQIRNLYTTSTDDQYRFGNGVLMKSFFTVSSVDSLVNAENTPNSFNRILADKSAIDTFLQNMWLRGSTGNVPTGETFGQGFKSDGVTPTQPEDHFFVQADIVNNPQSSLNLGNRNEDSWFTFPTPAGSIKIGWGFLVR